MHTHCAQEFVTIRGSSATTITQGHNAWLDLSHYTDLVAWLEVRGLTVPNGSVTISYQTAPTADETSFVAMTSPVATIPFSLSLGVTVTTMQKLLMTVPLTRWFRWQLVSTSTSTWDVTFRLFLSANCLSSRHRRRR
jgi:hypothetical protein